MRVMASEIISTCTTVCPYLIRLSIMEGSIPHPPVTQLTSLSSSLSKNSSQSSDPFDDTIHLNLPPTPNPHSSSTPPPPTFLSPPRHPALDYQSQSILFVLIERILCDDETVVVEHLGDTLKVLLEPERIDDTCREKFLSLFYDYYMSWILLPFTRTDMEPDEPVNIISSLTPEVGGGVDMFRSNSSSSPTPLPSVPTVQFKLQSSSATYASRRLLSEIFSLCIFTHKYRIKSLITRSNLLSKFLRLLTSRSRHYHIFPLKLMKNILTLKDEQYNRYIVKQHLFKPIFELFASLYQRDNIITSTIIDLLEFIRSERMSVLISYIAEKLRGYYRCCLSEKTRKEIGIDGRDDGGGGGGGRCRSDEEQKKVETEEEEKDEKRRGERDSSSSFTLPPDTCQSYYTELFETFELTYAQLKEYEADRERGERFQGGHQSSPAGQARSKRGPPGVVRPLSHLSVLVLLFVSLTLPLSAEIIQ
jgi:hypothetical protein